MTWRIRDLSSDDLTKITWSGDDTHLQYVAKTLERAKRNEVAHLAVCTDDEVVGLGAVDFEKFADSAVLWQINVKPDHQSMGIGTFLIQQLELQAAAKGFKQCELGVEAENVRAQDLYCRLGYRMAESYVDEGKVITVMRKSLA